MRLSYTVMEIWRLKDNGGHEFDLLGSHDFIGHERKIKEGKEKEKWEGKKRERKRGMGKGRKKGKKKRKRS